MGLYRTTFRVDAPATVVWDVLSDFPRYAEWNPSLPALTGELRPGAPVAMTLAMPGADWLFAGDRQFLIAPRDATAADVTHVEHVRRDPATSRRPQHRAEAPRGGAGHGVTARFT